MGNLDTTDVPTKEEVKAAVDKFKNNKAPGPDGTPSEMLKEGCFVESANVAVYSDLSWISSESRARGFTSQFEGMREWRLPISTVFSN